MITSSKDTHSAPTASLVTEESNDELVQFTSSIRGVTANDIRNALSPLATTAAEASSIQRILKVHDDSDPTLISEMCLPDAVSEAHFSHTYLPAHLPKSGKDAKTYVQKVSEVPICPTCRRPYMLSQLYFKLLQTVIENSRKSYYKHFFKQLARIGSGSFGTVYRVRHQLSTVELGTYAVKIISVGDSRPWLLKALSEVTVLEKLRHQSIVQYHHCWIEKHKTALNTTEETPHLFILLNYCKGGSLLNLRRSILNRPMTEEEVLSLLFQAASGLAHLHAIGLLSRDIKLGNILLDGDAPDDEPKAYIGSIYNDPADNFDKLSSRQKQDIRYKRRQFGSDESLRERCRQLQYIRKVGIEGLRVRIADFGQVGDGASAGTELYLAPELQRFMHGSDSKEQHSSSGDVCADGEGSSNEDVRDKNMIIRDGSFQDFAVHKAKSTCSTDIYSLGISFLLLLFDYDHFAAERAKDPHPLSEEAYNDYINSVEHQADLLASIAGLRAVYSSDLCYLLSMMCHSDPSMRPSASDIVSFCFQQQDRVYGSQVQVRNPVSVSTSILAARQMARAARSSVANIRNAIQVYSGPRKPLGGLGQPVQMTADQINNAGESDETFLRAPAHKKETTGSQIFSLSHTMSGNAIVASDYSLAMNELSIDRTHNNSDNGADGIDTAHLGASSSASDVQEANDIHFQVLQAFRTEHRSIGYKKGLAKASLSYHNNRPSKHKKLQRSQSVVEYFVVLSIIVNSAAIITMIHLLRTLTRK